MGEGGQKVHTSVRSKCWDVMYSMATVVNDTVLYILKLVRKYLKSSYHKKNV